jgi:hypothetical protein
MTYQHINTSTHPLTLCEQQAYDATILEFAMLSEVPVDGGP